MGPRKFLKFLKPKVFGPVFDFDPYRVNSKIFLILGSNPGNPPKYTLNMILVIFRDMSKSDFPGKSYKL